MRSATNPTTQTQMIPSLDHRLNLVLSSGEQNSFETNQIRLANVKQRQHRRSKVARTLERSTSCR